MRLLLACEFYFPSVGGVQEVMKQLAERFVRFGHQVTVATTRLPERDFTSLNGVEVVGFDIAGNSVRGMVGEVERYREFVRTFPCDAVMVKAAQQWTFDALWPVLDELTCRKVFIPCGFSGLYEPTYQEYFRELPAILRKWDHLIFYAEDYRDVNFARAQGIADFTILPNGASELEFGAEPDPDFRRRHGIPEDSFVILTVGSLTGMKGHRELAEAFARLKLKGGRHATLLLNGNEPPRPPVAPTLPAPALATPATGLGPLPLNEPTLVAVAAATAVAAAPEAVAGREAAAPFAGATGAGAGAEVVRGLGLGLGTDVGLELGLASGAAAAVLAAPNGPEPVYPGIFNRMVRVYRNEGLGGVGRRFRNYAVRARTAALRAGRSACSAALEAGRSAYRTGKRMVEPVRLVAIPLRVGVRVARVSLRAGAKAARMSLRIARSVRHEGLAATARKVHRGVYERTRQRRIWKMVPEYWQPPSQAFTLQEWLGAVNRRSPASRLALHTDYPRDELVQAYLAADLFVFASNIEYSPLVLFEAAAAGTPFLTVPVGNAEEIARWTGAGVVCPAPRDERGYTRVKPAQLAQAIARLAEEGERLQALGRTGRRRWLANFTWEGIARRYEAILQDRAEPCRRMVIREDL